MSVFAEFVAPPTVHPLGRLLRATAPVTLDLDTVVPTGGTTTYVWVTGLDPDALLADLRSIDSIDAAEVLDELPGRTLVRFSWAEHESPLFDLIDAGDARIVAVTGSGVGWTLRLHFPDQASLQAFVDAANDHGLKLTLHEQLDSDIPLSDGGMGLSPKQRETLRTAYEAGYFEVPRRVTLEELATEIGISEQGVSERLRRGLSTYLQAVLTEDGSSPDDGKRGTS